MRYQLFIIFLFVSFITSAQRVANFDLFQVDNSVNMKFTLRAGGTCYGYKILHSTDSIYYTEVIDYPSICGASGSDEYFSHTHPNPAVNQMNFYKVQLSTFEMSEVRRIYVSSGGRRQMQVIPNPVYSYNDEVKVRLFNASNKRVQGYIYNQFGIYQDYVDFTTRGEIANINVGALTNGLYVIWLTDGQQAFSCKFIVKR